ncbi:MAG: hypothetical protein NTU89_02530 [Candidatus Dependentiae bacterium]|nr:hypothetical protein [Candidatus Dependentiae bacterium]
MVNKFFFLIASFLFGGAFVQASDFPKMIECMKSADLIPDTPGIVKAVPLGKFDNQECNGHIINPSILKRVVYSCPKNDDCSTSVVLASNPCHFKKCLNCQSAWCLDGIKAQIDAVCKARAKLFPKDSIEAKKEKALKKKQESPFEQELMQGSLKCSFCEVPVREHLYKRCFVQPRDPAKPFVSGSAPGCHNRQYVQVRYSQPSEEISQEAKDKEFQVTYDFISKQ